MSNTLLPTLLSLFERSLPLIERLLEAKVAGALASPPATAGVAVPVLDVDRIAKAQAAASAQLGAIAAGLSTLKNAVQGVPADTSGIQGQIDQLAASAREAAQTVTSMGVMLPANFTGH